MKRTEMLFLLAFLSLVLAFATSNAGYGPGDGIPVGPDDGSGYGEGAASSNSEKGFGNSASIDRRQCEGSGAGKEESPNFEAAFSLDSSDEESSESVIVHFMRRLPEMIQNEVRNFFRVRSSFKVEH